MLSKFKYVFVALVAACLFFSFSNVSSAWEEAPARVTVTVSGLGAPLQGAEVNLGDASDTTGKNGSVVFQVNKGTYAVSCKGPHGGEDAREITVKAGEISQVVFELGGSALNASGGH